ncbi:MAG: metalloregulator ArsR/SmtB family transcription factor [Chloroflexi bacterium]|nr:metalloregulator ArsR/SmtB family transcription factor [Chloroflexota bacterium]
MKYCLTETPRVRQGELALLADQESLSLANLGKALGDPIRLQILHLLGQRPGLCTCEFQELLGLGQSKVSYHLKVLVQAGLISWETHGTWSHYSLANSGILAQLRDMAASVRHTKRVG